MVPATVAVLDSLPQTPSGKIDRLALPDPDVLGEQAVENVAPRTPLEQSLAAIWCGVLGLERVGAHDDFFTLGGHSLLATHAVVEVRSALAVDLPLYSLFEYPTVASLAAEACAAEGRGRGGGHGIRWMAELDALSG